MPDYARQAAEYAAEAARHAAEAARYAAAAADCAARAAGAEPSTERASRTMAESQAPWPSAAQSPWPSGPWPVPPHVHPWQAMTPCTW